MSCSNAPLSESTINPCILKLEYAVRGPIVERALQIEKQLKEGATNLPFKEVVKCNIGDSQATGQPPITYSRQLISLLSCPDLMTQSSLFPSDVVDKAKKVLAGCGGGSVGCYSHSLGVPVIRQAVADYIQRRDDLPADPECIFLSCGASEAIKYVLNLVQTGKQGNQRAGIMTPIPQYPLYSAINAEFNSYQINYYLDESNKWALPIEELKRAIEEAKPHCVPRALTVINPGNPTGHLLSKSDMEGIIRFAVDNNLVLLADEVYQFNIYKPEERRWMSFKRLLHEMGTGYADKLQLASFMSCSKGFSGECGARGGYCELINFHPNVRKHLYKVLSSRLCPPVMGQSMIYSVISPPQEGEPSYELFCKQRDSVLKDLKFKAGHMTECLNSLPGITCNPIMGAMYAFPRIHLPAKAIKAAKDLGQEPDFFYCLRFLEEKGICVVPGSGFGQQPGTFHFRTTILPQVDKIKYVVDQLKDFHTKFMAEFAD